MDTKRTNVIAHDEDCDRRHTPRQRCNRALASATLTKPVLVPWWLSPWWLGIEGTACALAFLTGAVILAMPYPSPLSVTIGISLVALGPANIGLSVSLWLMRGDRRKERSWSLSELSLVLAKVLFSLALSPFLILSIVLLAALVLVILAVSTAELKQLLGPDWWFWWLINALESRSRKPTKLCTRCGRTTSRNGPDLCGRCATDTERLSPLALQPDRSAGAAFAPAAARNGYFFLRRKRGRLNYAWAWHVILDGGDVGTLRRGEERRFEAAPGPHSVKVVIVFQSTNAIEFTSDERDVYLECGRDEEDNSRYRLKRVDAWMFRGNRIEPRVLSH